MLRCRLDLTQESHGRCCCYCSHRWGSSRRAVDDPMLVVIRILQGTGLGMLPALPLYLSEVSPPKIRGFLTGCSTMSFGTGYVVYALPLIPIAKCGYCVVYRCSWLSVRCYHATNLTLSWRLPLTLACVVPIALLAGLPFVPGGYR